MSVTLTGFDDLRRELDEMETKTVRAARRASAGYAARKFRGKFKAAVPVGTESTTKTRRNKDGTSRSYDYGRWNQNVRVQEDRGGDRSESSYRVTSGNAFWGWFYEMGTARQPARPILRPLFDSSVDTVLDDMRDGMERYLIRREARLAKAGL